MEFASIVNQRGSFYEVTDSQIEQAEKELQIAFPKELIKLYKEIGYGFLDSKKNESVLLSIEINEEQTQKIYLYNTVIAESLEEFIKLFLSDEDFFIT